MANMKLVYPLEEVLGIKRRRVEEQEKVVLQKQLALNQENEKLKEREKERDLVKEHKIDKLQKLRAELDKLTTSPKVQEMKVYLKVVDEKLAIEEKKVLEQKKMVEKAEKELEEAKKELVRKRLEVDKILEHKTGWIKEAKEEIRVIEESELDEIGSVSYLNKMRKASK